MVGFWGRDFRVRQRNFFFSSREKKDALGAVVDSR